MGLGHGSRFISAAFLPALLLAMPFQNTIAASVSACNGSDCWYETSTPVYGSLGPYPAFAIPYVNLFNATTTGIVFMVVHNSLGQTIQISTCVLQLGADANGTARTITFGLGPGMYSATFFVVSTGGYAISTTTTASFTV